LQGIGSDFITGGQTILLKEVNSTFQVDGAPTLTPARQVNGLTFRIETNQSLGRSYSASFFAPQGEALQVGTLYTGASRFPFNGPREPGLSISGNARGCNQLSGQFIVRQLSTDASGSIRQFVADFEQACDSGPLGSTNKLIGTVRFNSDLNFR
jgi:hypothetical protein